VKLLGAFIGLNRYLDDRIAGLEYSRSDAELFDATVRRAFLPNQVQTWKLIDQQATKQRVLTLLGETLARVASKDDIVFLYFSGHGSPETSEGIDNVSRYLITYDTEYDNIFATAIDVERDLVRIIERIRSSLILVILDACFSGRAGGRTFEGPRLNGLRDHHREAIQLSALKLGSGRVILSACDDDQVAYEDSVLQHGVFTHFLLEALTSSGSVAGSISITELYDKVMEHVQSYSMGRQTPVMNGRVVGGRVPRLLRIN
jgi:uncharacterized caspase-like protein